MHIPIVMPGAGIIALAGIVVKNGILIENLPTNYWHNASA